MTWKQSLGRTAVLGIVIAVSVGVGVGVANAVVDGRRGEHTRTALTIAGTLTGVTGNATATFTITNGSGLSCTPPAVPISPGAGGAFSAEIDIERCPTSIFDGSNANISATVTAGGTTFSVPSGAINPVPYARYADQYGTPDCPVGYSLDPASPSDRQYCRKSFTMGIVDELVRVGTGATAFWIDRYEARVFRVDSSPVQLGAADDNFGTAFPDNGQWTIPAYAVSARGGLPSRFITWYQANQACRLAGKRLASGEEWLLAATGTVDPSVGNDGLATGNTGCNTNSSTGDRVRTVGGGLSCVSTWGAYDVIGNVWEWTSDWHATLPIDQVLTGGRNTMGPGYSDDATLNISSQAYVVGSIGLGQPAASLRGGAADTSIGAGIFALDLRSAPSNASAFVGFRCVIPR